MTDKFSSFAVGRDSPGLNVVALTADAVNDIANRPRFLIVGTAGTMVCDFDNATSVTVNVPAGVVPISPIRWRSGTAAGVVGCW